MEITMIAPIISAISVIVMCAITLGTLRGSYATKEDLRAVENKMVDHKLVSETGKASLVTRSEFQAYQEKVDRRFDLLMNELVETNQTLIKTNTLLEHVNKKQG